MLKIILSAIAALLAVHSTSAQELNPTEVVQDFFHAMYDADTSTMALLMHSSATLTSASLKDGQPLTSQSSSSKFLQSVGSAKPGEMDEQISDIEMTIDGGLATVTMQYSFYYKDQFSHCGINVFTLMRQGTKWKIMSIADSRRKTACQPHNSYVQIDEMIDAWHLAAAEADSAAYFSLMTHDAVFVGTDAGEVWSKREFLAFAAPYFAKGKAWAFTKKIRNIYYHNHSQIAWFDELIDTWMGPCRGSGVAVSTPSGWKIQHYVLSVTVPNDDIKEFIKIAEQKEATKE